MAAYFSIYWSSATFFMYDPSRAPGHKGEPLN